jgi:hypothetical protein
MAWAAGDKTQRGFLLSPQRAPLSYDMLYPLSRVANTFWGWQPRNHYSWGLVYHELARFTSPRRNDFSARLAKNRLLPRHLYGQDHSLESYRTIQDGNPDADMATCEPCCQPVQLGGVSSGHLEDRDVYSGWTIMIGAVRE